MFDDAAALVDKITHSFCLRIALPPPLLLYKAINPDRNLVVADHDAWILNLDHESFKKEVAELGARLEEGQGIKDVEHIQKICRWSNGFGMLGLATMWLPVNPITVIALSLWTFSRW